MGQKKIVIHPQFQRIISDDSVGFVDDKAIYKTVFQLFDKLW